MEFFTRVLSGSNKIKERSREAEQVNEVFKSNLDGLKNLLQSEESTDLNSLLDMVYESSFPEEQVFLKTPYQARLRSKRELVVRLLIGLEALGVPAMTDLLVFIKKHGMEGIANTLVTLLELLSPLLDGKQAPEFTTDDVVDAMDFEWHSTSRKGSPLLNVIASATSSPRASAASAGDSPFPSFLAASPFRRALSDRSMFLSRAHEAGSKSVLDKTSSAKPTLTSSISSQYRPYSEALRSDELTYLNIPPISLPPVEEQPTSSSRDGSPVRGLQKKHRRKSSSLRQLFAEEGSEELLSEGSVGALSKRNSISSSRGRTSSEFATILLNANNEPSSPFLSRGANTEATEKESLLKAEDEHMEVGRSGKESQVSPPLDNVQLWREDAGGPFVDLSGNKDNILNPVALTASLMTLNSDAEATAHDVGDAGMGTVPPFNTLFMSINDKLPDESTLPAGRSKDSMQPATSSEVEVDEGLNVATNAHSSLDNDGHIKLEQNSRNESIADAGDNGECNANESEKYNRASNNFDRAPSNEGTLPLQEDTENSAAYSNASTNNQRTLFLPEDMDNFAAYSKAPAIDESSLPLQDNTENSAEPLQDNNMESVAATNDGSTTVESTLPMQESDTERSATYSHAPTIGVSRGLRNLESSGVYSNASIPVDKSTIHLEDNMKKSSAATAAPRTMDESIPPLQDNMEISSASNDASHPIDDSTLPLQDDMENAAARSNVPTNDQLYRNAIEDASHELLRIEPKNVLQHGTHQRSRSDSTPARSLFKAESMKEEELNGSQSDRNSNAEGLRRRFIERLGSFTSSMESLMGKGESPDRVVGVVMQESMPWMQMNEGAYKKSEGERKRVSSSESDSESSTTSTSSSSSAEGLDVYDRQQPHERELEPQSENDKHIDHEVLNHASPPDSNEEGDIEDINRPDLVSTYIHEGDAERALGLQADHHLQGESKVDAQQEDNHSHLGFGLLQQILAPLLLPSSTEPAVDAFNGLHQKESEKGIERVDDEVDESAFSNPREGEFTGSKDESTYDSIDNELDMKDSVALLAPLLLPSSTESAVDAFDGLHQKESEEDIERVDDEDDESASFNPREGEFTGSKHEYTYDSKDNELDVKDGVVAFSGKAKVTHLHQAAHSQIPSEAANARVVQVNIPLNGTSRTDVSDLYNTHLLDEEDDSINIQITEYHPPIDVSCVEHDSFSASNGEDYISEAKSIEPFRDNRPTDVSHVEDDSFSISNDEGISEASSGEPFDDNHQSDGVDLYSNTQVLSDVDGLRTNSELSTLGKVDTLGMHQRLVDRELSQSISNLQENESDLHQTPDHDASTALSSLVGDEKMSSKDEDSPHQGHEDLEVREQGNASNGPPISSSKWDEKVFSGDEGSESQRREAMEMREQGDEDNEAEYYSLGADRFFEDTTLPTEPVVLQENENIVNLQPNDAVTLTIPRKAHQQPLCGSPLELEEHLKYNDSQFEQLLTELDTTEEDAPLHALSAKSDTEGGRMDTNGREKVLEDGVVIGLDFEKMAPEVGDSSSDNETISQLDVRDLSLGRGTVQSDGKDLGFGKETKQPNVESLRLGKQIMQSDDRHLGLDMRKTLPWNANLEREFVDSEGQFIVGGPGPIADLDECKLQADPETSYQPKFYPHDENSSPKEGLHGSRVIYEASTDNSSMHAHSPDSQAMASSDEHKKPMEGEEVHIKFDGKQEDVKYPLLVEGVLQEEILSKPVYWEASEVVDAGSIHPLQADEGNVQTISVAPRLAAYAAQLQEGVGADLQKNVSPVLEEAYHDAHQPPLTARTLDDNGPFHGHPTYGSAAEPTKSVSHVCEEVSHDAPLTARSLDNYGSLHGHPTEVFAGNVPKSVSLVSEEASHDVHQLPLTARTSDDNGPLHGHATYVPAANVHVEPDQHMLNQPAASPHDPHMDRWDINSTMTKSKRKRSYAAKLVRGCLSCCRQPGNNT